MPTSRCEQAQHQLFHDPRQTVRGICVFPVLFSAYTNTRAQTHVHAHTHSSLPVGPLRADEEDVSRTWTPVSRTKWESWAKKKKEGRGGLVQRGRGNGGEGHNLRCVCVLSNPSSPG